MSDPRGTERRRRFGLLMVAILAAFVVQGVVEPGRWEHLVVSLLLAVTLLLALEVAQASGRTLRTAAIVSAVLATVSLVNAIIGDGNAMSARFANLLLIALAPPAIVTGILRTLRLRNRVTIEIVFGALCLYLLLGLFFAEIYGALGRLDGSFFAGGVATTVSRCLYFSFATLTTVGYGDLTARTDVGHTLAVTEALLGQIYLVTVVAVIVGNLGRGRTAIAADPGGSSQPEDR